MKTIIALLIVCGVAIGIISQSHPIILKWVTGSARIVGIPVNATVYTNQQLNHQIKVFHISKYWDGEKADYYILNFQYADTKETREIINLNVQHSFAGRPSGSNRRDYDIICGLLFQSEVGSRFTDFRNSLKGYGFDPRFSFIDSQIKLNLPPKEKKFKCDSLIVNLKAL